jgi:group I intron endonuclease
MKYNTGIYQIKNISNEKRYIGSAVNLYERKFVHFSELKNNKHKNGRLQNSFNKYGFCNFEFSVLFYCDKINLLFYEQRTIDFFESYDDEKGYNINKFAGSSLGNKWSEESKLKVSILRKGRKLTEEQKRKMSLSRKGKKFTEDHKKKISIALKGKQNGLGTKHSEESKLKMSQRMSGINHPQVKLNWSKVLEIRKMKHCKTIKELSEIYNVSKGCIIGVVYNYTWKHGL